MNVTKIPTKKLRNGFEIPIFGFGGWRIGGEREPDYTHDPEDVAAIKMALDAGITHIDTAEKYSGGHSEELIGKAIKESDRKKLFLVSKVNDPNLGRDNLLNSLKGSLRRLGTDYLDLYLVHKPNPEIAIEETMGAMDEAVEAGLIKNFGVSNFLVEELDDAQAVAKNKIVCNQVYYNLGFRKPEKDGMLEYCQKNDIILTAWRPVQKGMLAKEGIKILDTMAAKYDKTPAQIAINWLISQPNVITISKMGSRQHIIENLGAMGWNMEEGDIERLRADFPNQIFEYELVKW